MKMRASDICEVALVMRTQSSSVHAAAAQRAQVHGAQRGQHTSHQLLRRHFHRENADGAGLLGIHGGVLGHVHGERGLTHRRATGDDHEVARAQTAGDVIEIGEAGLHALERIRVLLSLVDLVDQVRQHVAHG